MKKRWPWVVGEENAELRYLRTCEWDSSKGIFECSCGKSTVANKGDVRRGKHKSCGHAHGTHRTVTIGGVVRKLHEVRREHGVSRQLVQVRIRRGWTTEQACTMPVGTRLKGAMKT